MYERQRGSGLQQPAWGGPCLGAPVLRQPDAPPRPAGVPARHRGLGGGEKSRFTFAVLRARGLSFTGLVLMMCAVVVFLKKIWVADLISKIQGG